MIHIRRLVWPLCLAAVVLFELAKASAEDKVDYTRDIKPLLKQRCYACHGALQQRMGLRLDTAAAIRKGGDSGEIFEPGKPDDSRLIERVTADEASRMPPKDEGTALNPAEVELLRRWISEGATGPADEQPEVDPRAWWSYQPIRRPELPVVRNSAWVKTPIDHFIAAGHEAQSLTPQVQASREVWLRRVSLDLIGLPPTRAELQAFLADSAPNAEERVVDQLLSRPEYGERWGRHWMDVWRYSDWYGSRGINEIRYGQRHLWRWRDWIVESLNEDKPYDRMILEMLAGDELAGDDPQVTRATGFLGRNWYKFDRNVWMFDTVEHTSQAFLGLTLRCCRCHDHKYDPISQEDYYRFRAFFEPHDVRTDRLAADTGTEKDATLGQVLKDGVARIYDRQLDAPTYVFQRGDGRYPDEKRPVKPGVPAALGNEQIEVQPVQLPSGAFYPALRPFERESLTTAAALRVRNAEQEIDTAKQQVAALETQIAERIAAGEAAGTIEPKLAFRDDFSVARPQDWKVVSGDWVYENQRLIEKSVAGFCTIVSTMNHPRNFHARWKFRPLEAGDYRSIGFSFDYLDQGNSQDIYTHLTGTSQGIQAFHRLTGQQVYPAGGIVKTQSVLKVGEVAVAEVFVHGQQFALWLNGVKLLDYVSPVPRRDGKFALWVHEGTAEFLELEIREQAATLEALKRDQITAADRLALGDKKRAVAVAEGQALAARIAAELARYGNAPASKTDALALVASRAERTIAVARAEETLLQAEQQRARLQTVAQPNGATNSGAAAAPAVVEAQAAVTVAQAALATARAAVEQPDGKYTPLGPQFPATSTGRRLALARWIASPKNPRTARIAANHIWLRHFGQAIVPSTENFGLNGKTPSHPELLDWLASELIENGWRMKPLHKQIVLSATYRLSSVTGTPQDSNRIADNDNRSLWRMNSRRMEAEVVRDCVLFTAGRLDRQRGGAEIPEAEGQSNLRRSLYFRSTPNEKMKFLELFDAADPNGCYRRKESVVPQQALALMNSGLAIDQARTLAEELTKLVGEQNEDASNTAFIQAAFEQVLSRSPTREESAACLRFLAVNAQSLQTAGTNAFAAGGVAKRPPHGSPHLRARENLVHVLYCHNDFVTIR